MLSIIEIAGTSHRGRVGEANLLIVGEHSLTHYSPWSESYIHIHYSSFNQLTENYENTKISKDQENCSETTHASLNIIENVLPIALGHVLHELHNIGRYTVNTYCSEIFSHFDTSTNEWRALFLI